jgi:hypothetical protein
MVSYFVFGHQQTPIIDTRAEKKKQLQDSNPRRRLAKARGRRQK